MSAGVDHRDSERHTAYMRAFALIQDMQGDVPGAAAELRQVAALGASLGWAEVERAGLFGRAVSAWIRRDPSLPTTLETLIDRSRKDGSPAMLAAGLALRSDVAFSGFPGHEAISGNAAEADLARAVVLLENAEGEPLERITAHTACGIAFGNRWLFELGDEQYKAAIAVGETRPAGSVDFIVAPVMFNRAEVQVQWSSMLWQLGDHEGIAERWRTWKPLEEAAAAFAVSEAWRLELTALGVLMAAIAGEDRAAEAGRLLALDDARGAPDSRPRGLLKTAIALSDRTAKRPDALRRAAEAVGAVHPSMHPQVYDLALCLHAEMAARDGTDIGLRYGRRQLSEHWASRLATLGAMRARLQAERLVAERDMLRRHAELDDLTGIANRRAMEHYLAQLQRKETSRIALIMLDMDAFKVLNDRHGHPAGDAVLVRVARALATGVRSSDLAVRIGGDEFVVILADADLDTGFDRAVDLLVRIGEQSFDDIAPAAEVSLSAGVASGPLDRMSAVRAQADEALYRAKAGQGRQVLRNKVAAATTYDA